MDNIKNNEELEERIFNLYSLLLGISSSLSLLSCIDIEDEKVDKKEFIDGIKLLSMSMNNDVKECIKLTNI